MLKLPNNLPRIKANDKNDGQKIQDNIIKGAFSKLFKLKSDAPQIRLDRNKAKGDGMAYNIRPITFK